MANFYVSGSPSAPVTHVKLFISYALNHVTTATVKDVFDSVFNNEVTEIVELVKKDRDTGKSFKLFWITLEPERHSPVWRFVDEIEKFDKASIIYETHKGKDFYWQVRLNKDKVKPVKTMPRIMAREETTSTNATDKERADVIAFTKTPAFTKLVESVVFEGVISPKLEPGEIKEKSKFNNQGKRSEAMADASIEAKRQRLEEQEAALADWEANA
jgi:Cu2+-containing amine oxidase